MAPQGVSDELPVAQLGGHRNLSGFTLHCL